MAPHGRRFPEKLISILIPLKSIPAIPNSSMSLTKKAQRHQMEKPLFLFLPMAGIHSTKHSFRLSEPSVVQFRERQRLCLFKRLKAESAAPQIMARHGNLLGDRAPRLIRD